MALGFSVCGLLVLSIIAVNGIDPQLPDPIAFFA
jgi:hypothetical protein